MIYSKISKDTNISKICFGCEPLGGSDWGAIDVSEIELAINCSLDLGINFFDTADVYGLGLSEQRLSKILAQKRHELVIATKGGVAWNVSRDGRRAQTRKDSSPNYLRLAVENSLKRLRLDILPIYYVHWPDPDTDIKLSFDLLSRLKDEGKIKHIGCSNFTPEQIIEACEVTNISMVQLPVNILESSLTTQLIDVLKKNKIHLIAYNVLANGLLSGKYNKDAVFTKNDRRSRLPLFQGNKFQDALKKVKEYKTEAEVNGLSLAQYSIRWVLGQNIVASAITGIKNKSQLIENIKGAE